MRPVAFAWVFLRFPLRQGERTPCERMCRAVTRDGAVMVSTDLQRSVRVCDAAWVTAGAVVRVSQGAKLAVFKIAVLVLGLEVVLDMWLCREAHCLSSPD